MKKIVLGEAFGNIKHDFRETCFGLCLKDNKILLTFKTDKQEYALPGGGVEKGETHAECLKREFLEEVGYELKNIREFVTIDCFWMAGNVWPMESLANIFIVDIGEKHLATEAFCDAVWLDLQEAIVLLQLPYQKKALQLLLENKQR